MTFEDLLRENPALRYLRSLDADTLRSLFRRSRGECTWCGSTVPKGRRTWCSNDCAQQFLNRCSPGHAAAFVHQRDKGICAICKQDVEHQKAAFEAAWKLREVELQQAGITTKIWHHRDLLKVQFGFARGQWYEIDHETPVCEGGGLCDPSGLRLLCGKCHKDETAELAARNATKTKTKKKATTR